MAVAIVHYHLRRGGVTRVIEAQSQALREADIDHVILAGTRYQGRADLPVVVVPDLDYQDEEPALGAEEFSAQLRSAAATATGSPIDLWHLHNPLLGKNPILPGLVASLAQSPDPIVLHFHDFAEDGRPRNYEMLAEIEQLYPIAPHLGYAFINSRDRQLLINAGVPAEQTALLPNAIVPPAAPKPVERAPDSPAIVLYPVRGIRRKNLGELCLLAGLAPKGARFAVTLAPENPLWHKIHDQWVRFANDEVLPVEFGVVGHQAPAPGIEPTFENWLSHATHLITTSVAEGFGMSFLEPIALGKPLLGRDLPEITRDFELPSDHADQSPALGHLYDRLLIPQAWVDQTDLERCLEHGLQKNYARYQEELSVNAIVRAGNALRHHGYLDFGVLPEPLQREAARRAFHQPNEVRVSRNDQTQPAAPWLAEALQNSAPTAPPSILDRFSISNYASRLTGFYRTLHQRQPAPPEWLPKSRVLHQFLQPERFHFLRT